MVQLLLEADANPNNSREGHGTALQGYELIATHLLEAKADVNLHGVRHPKK